MADSGLLCWTDKVFLHAGRFGTKHTHNDSVSQDGCQLHQGGNPANGVKIFPTCIAT